MSQAALEGAFVDELALLQPTPGYIRLVKDRILHVWEQRRAEADERAYDGNRFNRTAATAPLFNYLAPAESADEEVVSPEGIESKNGDFANSLVACDFWR